MSDELEAFGKVGGEILNDPSVRQFIGQLTGEPAEQLGGLVSDRIRWWRFKQAIKLCLSAKQLLDDAGLKAHEVRPGVLVPILEGATLADDDETLQDRWAALLANAATRPADAIPPSFPYILGQLSATDAKLLDAVFDAATAKRDWRADAVNSRELAHVEGIDGRDFDLGLDNLIRLRAVGTQATYGGILSETVMLTTLGYELVRACRAPALRPESTA